MLSRDVLSWLSNRELGAMQGGKSVGAKALSCALAAGISLLSTGAQAKEWGMVVGVNDYKHFPPFSTPAPAHFDLQGAVNDAKMIAEAMHASGVDLPANRLLLDEDATLENFMAGWRELTSKATAGDTLIVTFAGHGAREEEVAAPFDEPVDNKDETIMFHEFDPENPRIGRLNDDQLTEMLAAARAFKIIWVMDSCHSAGLNRSAAFSERPVITRNGGSWAIPITPLVNEVEAKSGDETHDLAHVTHVLATSSEEKQVTEIVVNGQNHGALSVYFSKALRGAGDANDDGIVTRGELSAYLQDRVFSETNQQQQPRLLPRGDGEQIWDRNETTTPVADAGKNTDVRVMFDGVIDPQVRNDLAKIRFQEVSHSADLIFKPVASAAGPWQVFNFSGDEIRQVDARSPLGFSSDVAAQIGRIQLLRGLRAAKNDDLPPIEIVAGHANQTHPVGSLVSFTFHAPRPDMPYLTLFNVASNGVVQNLYPTGGNDDGRAADSGFVVKFKITPPTGADQLVAVFCNRPPLDLRAVLADQNGAVLPNPATLTEILSRTTCQVNITGLFTSAS